ncbi:MAG TPA: 5'/3'-nucleotidase SurE [Geminicoccaceae bacterium]|nr:5'/3'-nucleotidase SurE [Geminicoccaceae bacterium]
MTESEACSNDGTPVRGPRILVTNDDGINAPGLRVLERVARALSTDVWVVAPETNQSGASHSLTMQRPLRIRKLSRRRFAVDGTPTDCVLLALQIVVKNKPVDLVLSGVNHGGNLGEDVTYSGTIAAAMEATLFNVPAFALSQCCRNGHPVKWATAEQHAADIIGRLFTTDWPKDLLINVNFPDCPAHAVSGYQVTTQGKRKLGDELLERIDPRGQPYVWIGGLRSDDVQQAGTDLQAVAHNYISVTPVHMDMTHRASFDRLRRALQ